MQRLLLDTHAFVWSLSDVSRLSQAARAAIVEPRNDIFVSAITGWEIAVKRAKGRMTAPDHLSEMIEERGFNHLPLTLSPRRAGGTSPDASPGPVRPAAGCPSAGRRAGPRHPGRPHSTLRHPYADGVAPRTNVGPGCSPRTHYFLPSTPPPIPGLR